MGDRLGTPSAVSKCFFFNFFSKFLLPTDLKSSFLLSFFLMFFCVFWIAAWFVEYLGWVVQVFVQVHRSAYPAVFGDAFFSPLELAFRWRNVSLALRLIRHLPFVDCKQYLCKIRYSNKAIQSFLPSGLIYNVFTEIFSFLYSTSHLLSFWNFRPKK